MFQQSFSQTRPEYQGSTNQAQLLAYQNIEQRKFVNQGKIDAIDDFFATLDVDDSFNDDLENIKSGINSDIETKLKTSHLSDLGDFVTNISRDVKNNDVLKNMIIKTANIRKADELIADKPEQYQQYYFGLKRDDLLKGNLQSNDILQEIYNVPEKKDIQAEIHKQLQRFVRPDVIGKVSNELFYNPPEGLDLNKLDLDPSYLNSDFISNYEERTDKTVNTYGDLEELLIKQIFGESGDIPTEFGEYLDNLAFYENKVNEANDKPSTLTGRTILKANMRGLKSGLEYEQRTESKINSTLQGFLAHTVKPSDLQNPPNTPTGNIPISPYPLNVTREMILPTDEYTLRDVEKGIKSGIAKSFENEDGSINTEYEPYSDLLKEFSELDHTDLAVDYEDSAEKFIIAIDEDDKFERLDIHPSFMQGVQELYDNRKAQRLLLQRASDDKKDDIFTNPNQELGYNFQLNYSPNLRGDEVTRIKDYYANNDISIPTISDISNEVDYLADQYIESIRESGQELSLDEEITRRKEFYNSYMSKNGSELINNEELVNSLGLQESHIYHIINSSKAGSINVPSRYNYQMYSEINRILDIKKNVLDQQKELSLTNKDSEKVTIIPQSEDDEEALKQYVSAYWTDIKNLSPDEVLKKNTVSPIDVNGEVVEVDNDLDEKDMSIMGLTKFNNKLYVAFKREFSESPLFIPTDIADTGANTDLKLNYTDNLKAMHVTANRNDIINQLESIHAKHDKKTNVGIMIDGKPEYFTVRAVSTYDKNNKIEYRVVYSKSPTEILRDPELRTNLEARNLKIKSGEIVFDRLYDAANFIMSYSK